CVVHHSKKLHIDEDITANCSRGSNAILADFVSQIAIDQPNPKSEWKRLQVLKENLGIRPKPVGFRPTDTGLEFGEAARRPGKDKATGWLRARMKTGVWYPAQLITDEAEDAGFPRTGTLERAKKDLGVTHRKKGKSYEWRRDDAQDEDITEVPGDR